MTFLTSALKKDCCGCRACAEICPKKCIQMREDEEGSHFPVIDKTMCINCRLCEKTCPYEYNDFLPKEDIRAAVGICKDEQTFFDSSSGGAFTAIYTEAINSGYTVYGVKFDDDFNAVTDCAVNLKECEPFRKSKYVMANTNHCFTRIEKQLKNSEKVLFSGTPCQCAALLAFLKAKSVDCSNLVTTAVLCAGVPESKIFEKYRQWLNENSDSKLYRMRFKSKHPLNGEVNTRTTELEFENGVKRYVTMNDDPYLKGYYSRLFYRISCGYCRFARSERITDITIGDAWGINKIFSDYNSLSGVSLIVANTEKGYYFLDKIADVMQLKKLDADYAVNSQGIFRHPSYISRYRNKFFRLLEKSDFDVAVNKSLKSSFLRKCASKVKHLLFS